MLVTLWLGAVLLAAVGTIIGFDASPGVNWPIWTWLAGAGLLVAASRGPGRRVPGGVAVCVVLAALLSLGAAITSSPELIGLIVVGVIAALAIALRLASDVPVDALGAPQMVVAPPVEGLRAVLETGARIGEAGRALTGEKTAGVVRGLLIGIPVAAVFALILSGADPVLERWREALMDLLRRVEILPRLLFGLVLWVCVMGAYGLALKGVRPWAPRARSARLPTLGAVEQAIVVWSVAGVFGLWLALQVSYLFLDTTRLRVSGMTYAEYVHRGFGELTFAATGCVLLLLALDVLSDRTMGSERVTRRVWWGMLALVAELLCVLVSAYRRVEVYEGAYGYTVARVFVQVYVGAMAIALAMFAWEVWRGRGMAVDVRRYARRVGLLAALVVVVLSMANVDGWVVARNVDRYRSTGMLDAVYLAAGDVGGVPEALSVLPALPPTCALWVRRRVWLSVFGTALHARGAPWYEWNLEKARVVAAFRDGGMDAWVAAGGAKDTVRSDACAGVRGTTVWVAPSPPASQPTAAAPATTPTPTTTPVPSTTSAPLTTPPPTPTPVAPRASP